MDASLAPTGSEFCGFQQMVKIGFVCGEPLLTSRRQGGIDGTHGVVEFGAEKQSLYADGWRPDNASWRVDAAALPAWPALDNSNGPTVVSTRVPACWWITNEELPLS